MRKMVMLLRASSKKEKRFLYVSYLLDVFLISIVLMIVKLLEETSFDLSDSDAGQSAMMVTGVILVAVMIIAFFLWLIAMEFKGLYDSRTVFNRNVKLMGYPGIKLMMLYCLEMLYMQIPCVAGGCVLGAVVYHFYAVGNSEAILWMNPGIMIAAIVIHMCILVLTVVVVGGKCVKQSAVTEQRGNHIRKEKKTVLIIIRLGVVAAMVFVIQKICGLIEMQFDTTDALVYTQALKLAYIAVLVVGFAPVMRLVFRITEVIGRKTGALHFVISLKLNKSYWGRFLVMSFLMILSASFFCGLYTLFGVTRECADSLSRESIYYQSYYIFDELSERGREQADGEAFYTLRYRTLTEDGGHIWVTGITGDYLDQYETFQTAKLMENGVSGNLFDDEKLAGLLESEDFDGIILDDAYSDSEGEKIVLDINGKEVSFTIYTTVLSHNTNRIDAYASRAYLEKQLGAEGFYNTVFYMNEPESVDMDHVVMSQTNEQIWEENESHVVQGTGTMELIFWMILVCSIFAVCTCLIMSGFDNKRNLAYLQGIGTGKKVLAKIYFLQVIWNVACTVLPVSVLTYLLAKGIGYMLMNPGYYQGGFRVSPAYLVFIFVVYLAISMVMQLFLIKKATKNEEYIRVLRN